MILSSIVIAYILDLIFGDPQWYWHPVRIIGRIINKLEMKLNTDGFGYRKPNHCSLTYKIRVNPVRNTKAITGEGKISNRVNPVRNTKAITVESKISNGVNKIISGSVLVILVISLTVFSVWFTLKLAKLIHPFLYHTLFVLLIYFALSIRSLGEEAKKVYLALRNNNIQEARNGLSMLVGRDTDKLNEPEIIRASVETVAESIMDGIIAPLFYSFIGGPVLAWAYKAINTMDSMVGHRSERFIKFGKPAAKLDGLVNFIPAKITSFLISASCFFYPRSKIFAVGVYRKDWFNSIKWGLKYFFRGPEFNSIATEAAMAGALKIQLGGVNYYKTVPISKPLLGNSFEPLDKEHIIASIRVSYICSALFLILGAFLIVCISWRTMVWLPIAKAIGKEVNIG